MAKPVGAFVGLTTLDMVYAIEGPPVQNTKHVVSRVETFAGGPAANAAVTFVALGGRAVLTSAIGRHPLGILARRELEECGVEIVDLIPDFEGLPALASVLVSQPGGDRTVVSTGSNALPKLPIEFDALAGVRPSVLLVDGHLPRASGIAARQARGAEVPVVMDGGTWKDELGRCLESTDYAICGEEFLPPGCTTDAEALAYLRNEGATHAAITRGERPILTPHGEVPVEAVEAVDTLAAGDIFHGAFCYYAASGLAFEEALRSASLIARRSCESFGPRSWIDVLK